MPRTAIVTGASSGIGAATARCLATAGFEVVLVARREDRLKAVADWIRADGGSARVAVVDVTDRAAVAEFAESIEACDVLVNNAGGAYGTEYIATADAADWEAMYRVNVLGSLHVTQALLPKLAAGGDGVVVLLSSTAGFTTYEGGGGYSVAKHGVHAVAGTLRLELSGQPVRVVEIAPGMVRTEEFSMNRYRGDEDKAAAVYAGVAHPLTAEDVADAVTWAVTRPAHVDIDFMVIRPLAQAAQHKVHREL